MDFSILIKTIYNVITSKDVIVDSTKAETYLSIERQDQNIK